uniref:Ig-like domain-containing protein n=1 Tax=Myripristis murdjan TaxID=586833 RepID=A0A667XHK4_9TELE
MIFFSFFSNLIFFSSEIPTPTLTRLTQWSDVFHKEYVELSCDIHTPSDWTYVWFKNGTELSGSNEATLSIQAASDEDAGKYRCRGRHKTRSRSVSTKTSLEFELKVYGEVCVSLYIGDRGKKTCTIIMIIFLKYILLYFFVSCEILISLKTAYAACDRGSQVGTGLF